LRKTGTSWLIVQLPREVLPNNRLQRPRTSKRSAAVARR